MLATRRLSFTHNEQARLHFVSDGRGQLLAVGDSLGMLTDSVSTGGSDGLQGEWVTAGLASREQTFDAQRWTTASSMGSMISSFRTRQYDPQTR